MSISEETSRVLLDLANVETISGILSISQNASLKRTLLTTDRATNTIADIDRVRESNPRRSRSALGSFVDMCGCCGRRLVLAAEVVDFDVVADQIQIAVDADLKEARSALETSSRRCAVDDFSRNGLNFIVGSEGEGRSCHLGSFGTFGRCGTVLGVVDRSPAARGSRIFVEVLPSAFGILMQVCTGTLRVVDGFPAA